MYFFFCVSALNLMHFPTKVVNFALNLIYIYISFNIPCLKFCFRYVYINFNVEFLTVKISKHV